ncbi:hypothetical protein I302_105888 [Kwoniella bestiolae CBS 10118]|uniref:Uncharacterized protein n=1 Tax=Kwoniella bestiolae CBS 10118 TaxID=1296100 RepID=A0A1B9G2F2_9TREE|nr:hypothetical protein I302_05013 [Kwoniella bestiolae CBS 10118]OCF25200.1 hypothetical protein I302_05013 [Kwoniella bestiolae CBS 10118]
MSTSLETLRRQYLSLYPIYLISLPPSQILAAEQSQQYLVNQLLGERYQPEDEYRRKFWRKVVDGMEVGLRELGDEDLEIDERFYDLLTELMVSSNDAGPSTGPKTSYRTFIYDVPPNIPLGDLSNRDEQKQKQEGKIVLLEEQIAIQGGTTGLRTWTAALHLAHHILSHPRLIFPNQRELQNGTVELGAGTGFLSILLAQLGVDVISTDLGIESESNSEVDGEDEVEFGQDQDGKTRTPLGRLRYNVQLNDDQSHSRTAVRALDWTDASLPLRDRPGIWRDLDKKRRTIIAADVIYDPDLVPPLVDTIDVLLGEKNQAIISATVRNRETFEIFLDTCQQHNLQVRSIDVPPMDDSMPSFWDSALDKGTEVKIMRITRGNRL